MSSPRRRSRRNASAMKMVGALLAVHREAAGYTQRALAERLLISEELIASIEQGRRPLKMDLAVQLDDFLGPNRTLQTAVEHMPEVDLVPRWAEEYMDLEREALTLSWYDNQVLPGLLQTPAYARNVFRNDVPALTEDEIELRVAARMERQEVLHRREPPTICFIISEVTWMDRLGGDDVHVEQLRHLMELATLPGVTLQVMPVGRSFHAGLSGPFILIETPDHQRLGYTEAQRGSQLIADPDEVSILERKCAMLRTQALNPYETKGLLENLLGEQ
ncbi:XRE family transcriptional regulator [Streptomyces alfalfae]|uniref:Transcriptional regulator n=2 Tax=Streptomyces alfalfae TaxID=1642299 RepID=A0ABN4VEB5_9ACTN|nr:transcriptional regulator [Streptomyces alfalfae]AYA16199.1 XRE family transcriptional regulator [Streptomyces fradiae]RXX38183.1 XRE family transcriptional regulator [Streptomyces alfalfae]RZM99915.1 XRE family transcriptional regulator [Streptomyces alfalfae]